MWTSRRTFIPLLAAAVLLAGCGGSKKVAPQTYMTSACSAMKTWVQDLQKESQDVTSAVTDSPAKGKQLLSTLLERVIASTSTLITKLQAAGVPDVKDGDKVSQTLIDAFSEAKTNLQNLRDDVAKLDTTDPGAFATGGAELAQKLQQAFETAGSSLDKLSSPELEQMGKTLPECQSIGQ